MNRDLSDLKYVFPMRLTLFYLLGFTPRYTDGFLFESLINVPEGNAVIYIQRPEVVCHGCTVPVFHNKKLILDDLPYGAYFVYIADPGGHVMHSGTIGVDRRTNVDVKEGETIFLRFEGLQGLG